MQLPHLHQRITRSCCLPFDLMVSVIFLLLSGLWSWPVSRVTECFVGGCGNEREKKRYQRERVFSKEGVGSANWLGKYALWYSPCDLNLVALKNCCYLGKREPWSTAHHPKCASGPYSEKSPLCPDRGLEFCSGRSCLSLLHTFPRIRHRRTAILLTSVCSIVTKGSMAFSPQKRPVSPKRNLQLF